MTDVLTDVKKSLMVHIKDRLPSKELEGGRIFTIADEDCYTDPPKGEYNRPCVYLTFVQRRDRSLLSGTQHFDYMFTVTYEDLLDDEVLRSHLDGLFRRNEPLEFWYFDDEDDQTTTGDTMLVRTWTITENKTDREKNRLKGELTLTF